MPGPSADDVVALTVVDNAGVHRMKGVPARQWPSALANGAGMSPTVALFTASGGIAARQGNSNAIGDLRLRPDGRMLRKLPSSDGWWWAPADMTEQNGRSFGGCSRTFLRHMVERAENAGVQMMMAFELEWTVGSRDPQTGRWRPIHTGPGYGAHMPAAVFDQLRGIAADLDAVDCLPGQVHPEWADGQLEVSLPVRTPLRAADEVVLARSIIKRQAELQGTEASFAALSDLSQAGNGAHAHFSLHTSDGSLMAGGVGTHGLHPVAEHFVAGVIEHLPALTAFGSPTPLSYLRLRPSAWSGGVYACWGVENREAALRIEGLHGPNTGKTVNVEWKTVDASANPYQVLGGVIAAGLDGVDRRLPLPSEIAVDPASMTDEERSRAGLRCLPLTLDDAADALCADAALRHAMGGRLHESVVAVRRADAEAARQLEPAALLDRYRRTH